MNERQLLRVRLGGGEIAGHVAGADAGLECGELAARPLLVARSECYVELDVLAVDDGRERVACGGAPDHKLAGTVGDDGS
jgi:hypothetical protein